MGEHLRSAPLVEALLELRWRLREQEGSPPLDPAYPLVAGLLYDRVRRRYPTVEELPQSRLPADLLQYSVSHRFRSGPGRWPLAQIGPGIASLNFTSSYRWQRFEPAAKRFVGDLESAYQAAAGQPLALSQAMLRYINAVELEPEVQVLSFLREALHASIQFPIPRSAAPDAFSPAALAFHAVYRIDEPRALAALSIGHGNRGERPALLWDLSVVSAEGVVPKPADLAAWLSAAHGVIEDWFLRMIEGPLHTRFRGGTSHD